MTVEEFERRYKAAVLRSFEVSLYDGTEPYKTYEKRYNPYHDPSNGRFTSGGGSAGSVIFDAEMSGGRTDKTDINELARRYNNGGGSSSENSKENFSEHIDKSSKSDIIKSSDEISALGSNRFDKGFSEHNLNEHWGGTHDHSSEYPGFTKEQYAARALELIQSAADGKNVLGYKNAGGQIARYDVHTNDFVIGRPSEGIATMFKPRRKMQYFINLKTEAENNET